MGGGPGAAAGAGAVGARPTTAQSPYLVIDMEAADITLPTLDELKTKLTAAIRASDDERMLRSLASVVVSYETTAEDEWDKLSDYRKARIEEGLAQARRGEGVTRANAPKHIKLLQP